MTNKDLYTILWRQGKASIGRIRNKTFPCFKEGEKGINPLCYRFLKEEGKMDLLEIEELYYSYMMEFIKKKYPERVFALWMTEN